MSAQMNLPLAESKVVAEDRRFERAVGSELLRANCQSEPATPDWNVSTATETSGLVWPEPLADEAFYGLTGDVVQAIEPHSEADAAALLIQFLVVFGSVVGRAPHFTAEADRHGCNLYTVLVGETAKGRKGSSLGHVERFFREVDEGWWEACIKGGLASGEGLAWSIRDEIREPVKGKNGFEVMVTDPGVSDKRLLVVEPEFGRVLQVCERQTNTLSALIRQAWDGKKLATLTKQKAATASNPHVCIIGHVTADELRRLLSDTQAGNGFANRFLWACVRRSKLLPNGGAFDQTKIEPLVSRLSEAVAHARRCGEFCRDRTAAAVWETIYGPLSSGRPGLLGAMTSRAEAQVMRLALVYALLDCAVEIQAPHLTAALAVWSYCQKSAECIFGDSLGDPTADMILDTLRQSPEGMTRTQLSDLFRRHRSASEINRALGALARCGLAVTGKRESGGRPVEVWYSNAK